MNAMTFDDAGARSACIRRVLVHIDENVSERLPLSELAAVADLSISRFMTVFRDELGISPHQYICRERVRRAKTFICEGMSLPCVANEVGFFDQSHFSRHFKRWCGQTPGQFMAKMGGLERHAPLPLPAISIGASLA
ncbi:helix-turn-helix transcriptional regulator [Microvirga alba]|uniref:Helix-turn-helix transcriptional regulator n=1 Tax=Microvirga alba TaxID=2791025 RepID=A0A931BV75_9HYPH|nr:AraC family transcriptional regulator [Microvirga alba]MBF9235323.1 helix-turn-helix transcriptional regulator [Microvirga alba]